MLFSNLTIREEDTFPKERKPSIIKAPNLLQVPETDY